MRFVRLLNEDVYQVTHVLIVGTRLIVWDFYVGVTYQRSLDSN